MDVQQIELFVNTYIKSGEGDHPRLPLEITHFIQALQVQATQSRKTFSPDEIYRAWNNWKHERFDYIDMVREHVKQNVPYLQQLAYNRISEKEDLSSDQIRTEAEQFSKSFAHQLELIAKQPSNEQIDSAWRSWKAGYRY